MNVFKMDKETKRLCSIPINILGRGTISVLALNSISALEFGNLFRFMSPIILGIWICSPLFLDT